MTARPHVSERRPRSRRTAKWFEEARSNPFSDLILEKSSVFLFLVSCIYTAASSSSLASTRAKLIAMGRHQYTPLVRSHTDLPTFFPSLLVSSSSACLSLSLALTSFCWLQGQLEEEFSEAGVLAHAAAALMLRWASCSALASVAGTIGVISGRRQLIRLFAVATAIDLFCTLILLLILLLLTYAPTLSPPFSTFLCGAVTGGAPDEGLNRLGLGGLEICEEHWRTGMLVVILGAAVAIGLRGWGTAITWEHYGAVSKLALGARGGVEDEWYDTELMKREEVQNSRRMREMSEAQRRVRSSTLPVLMGMGRERPMPKHQGRYKSHSISGNPSPNPHRPQLVLVPVFVDGPRSASSDDSPAPPYFTTSPTHSRSSSTASTSPSRTRTTPPRRDPSPSFSSASGCRPHLSTNTSPRAAYVAIGTPTITDEPDSFESSSAAGSPSPKPRRSRSEDQPATLSTRERAASAELPSSARGLGLLQEDGERLRR